MQERHVGWATGKAGACPPSNKGFLEGDFFRFQGEFRPDPGEMAIGQGIVYLFPGEIDFYQGEFL
ncbi:hypothetical protein, partial [Roseibacillus ishigakijimensis]|uniref:hypothetical protein n=1 Tax=Roseibacillus ishigakijimensis TaxID=454146 RepID=UPI001F1F2848